MRLPIFVIVCLLIVGCNRRTKLNEYTNSCTEIYKSYKFFDNQSVDSVFYYFFLGCSGDNFSNLTKIYKSEKVERLDITCNNEKLIVDHFLNSLDIYNTIFWFAKEKKVILTTQHFFKGTNFNNEYSKVLEKGYIKLLNLGSLSEYNFAKSLTYEYVGNEVHVSFPPTACKIICSKDHFIDQVYGFRLEYLVEDTLRLNVPRFYLPKVGMQ